MLHNTSAPFMLAAAYLSISVVLLLSEATRSYATVMLYILPAFIFWVAWSFFNQGKGIAKRLEDDEFGYGG